MTPPPPGGGASCWLDDAPRPGWQNMAIDHALFELAEAEGRHLWRLYRWEPHCLSFGRHEPAARRYDRARIADLGLDTVRRPTGGRAVWHARELTYAVAAPVAAWGSLREGYRRIHEWLARAVAGLGAVPALAGDRTAPGLGAGACFAAAVGGEVVIGGRKVVGSAQRRGERALLQHGSMLLEDDQSVVRAVQTPPSGDADRDPAPGSPPPETTLTAVLGRPVSFAEAAAAVARTLQAEGIPAAPPEIPNEVLRRAARHYDSYRSVAWTWSR
ncbi:MAG: hypothetical protein R2882_12480 [Gemmatimonadales bacterium]